MIKGEGMNKDFLAVDLFAGAGGTSEGIRLACEEKGLKLELTAINHWEIAVETHSKNHPRANHFCQSVFDISPRKAVPGGYLDLLAASPECIYHSIARGGGPCNEQSRSGADEVGRWAEELDISCILIENVKEFVKWGPLFKRGKKKDYPNPRLAGYYFRKFLRKLKSLGYRIEWRILNSADYGAFTARRRFFLIAVKGNRKINWPLVTHFENKYLEKQEIPDLFNQPWKPAAGIIDWSIPGESIFTQKELCENTLKRICHGLEKYCNLHLTPFLVMLYGKSRSRGIDLPLPTILTKGGHIAVCSPFLYPANYAASGASRVNSVDKPLPSLTTKSSYYLCNPYLVRHFTGSYSVSIGKPLPTITTTPTQLCLCNPYFIKYHGGSPRVHPINEPMKTVDTQNRFGLIHPFLVKYYSNGKNYQSLSGPLPTVTTDDRFGLACPAVEHGTYHLDILYRMLEPHELSAAMGFRRDYKFTGTKTDIKKQIGNAVEVTQAKVLANSIIVVAAD